jgi:predicted regulator of Ras-like GTPase activity (Roadblock/LC7/MglB family)
MIEGFPTGTKIGDMEAPFKWILDHTKRFQGIVQVTIGDGKGYVLLDRGSPVGCFFILGGKILRGRMALKYLIGLPLVSLSIRKYSREELMIATRLLDPTEMISHPQAAISPPPSPPVVDTFYDREEDLSIQPEYSEGPEEVPEGEADIEYPNNLDTDLIAQLLLGKILRLPHVQAVTIFGKGTPVLSMGDMNLEPVVIFADDILQATKDITAVMETGAFLHYTLHVPSGYIIIAPYFDEYLCILTDPKINLGIVRKILKEIPAGKERMRGVV